MSKKKKPFIDQVYAKVGKRPQSTATIARKLGLVGDDDEPSTYHMAKTRQALNALIDQGRVVKERDFRFAEYRRA